MQVKRTFLPLAILLVIGFLWAPHSEPAEKKLMIAVGQEPSSMDPSLNNMGPDYVVTDNFVEYLMYMAPNGKLGPGLATSWKVSPNEKEMDFTLRKGVKFHSGDPLTAKDVAFSVERSSTKNPTAKVKLKSVDRVEVIDDYHFKIHFKEPDASFIPNRAGVPILSKSYYDRVGEERFAKNPSGTSPYKFVRHASGEYVDMERFEDYWGEKGSVKEARFYFIPEDTTRVAKLKAGEVDLINSCAYPFVNEIAKSKDLKVVKYEPNHPAPSVHFHNYNPNTPWYDKRVRLAMAYAIDWKAINNNILYGFVNHWPFLTPDEVGYDPEIKSYPYDPKRAKAILAEAGYPKGFDLKLYWENTGRYPMAREIAEAVGSYFEAIGIRTKLIGEETVAHISRMRASRKPDAEVVMVSTFSRSSESSYELGLRFVSDATFSIYSNPEVDKLLAEARATVNDAKRGEIIKKVVRILYDEVVRIPICDLVAFYAMKKNIDFTPTRGILHDLVLVKDVTVK
jgi:peptide/nickel transport system substrate-binding protein